MFWLRDLCHNIMVYLVTHYLLSNMFTVFFHLHLFSLLANISQYYFFYE